jgi:nucleoside-diphosphate-sugar epimerase
MRIFLAGATGAIGRPLLAQLVAHGHEMFAMVRSADAEQEASLAGAKPVWADGLDAAAVHAALSRTRPEVVIEQMTALPKANTTENRRLTAPRHARIRSEGGANLHAAARAAGVRRYIAQSSAFWAAPGECLADETEPFAFTASPGVAAGATILDHTERRVLTSPDLEGIVLRYGFFYGSGTWYAREGSAAGQLQKREFPIIGSGRGVWSFIHVNDAAAATISAMNKGSPGIYHVVDDQPSQLNTWLPAFARYVGAPMPPHVTEADALRFAGEDAVYYATKLRGASNAKAKRHLEFCPRPLEWLEAI